MNVPCSRLRCLRYQGIQPSQAFTNPAKTWDPKHNSETLVLHLFKKLLAPQHAHTHTHTHVYVCVYIYICNFVLPSTLRGALFKLSAGIVPNFADIVQIFADIIHILADIIHMFANIIQVLWALSKFSPAVSKLSWALSKFSGFRGDRTLDFRVYGGWGSGPTGP